MRKLLIPILIFLLTISFASASHSTDDAVIYYSFDQNNKSGATYYDASASSIDATIIGASSVGVGILNDSWETETTGVPPKYLNLSTRQEIEGTWTINVWVNLSTAPSTYHMIASDGSDYIARLTDDRWYLNSGGTCQMAGAVIPYNTWEMWTITQFANNSMDFFVNGAKDGTITCAKDFTVDFLGKFDGSTYGLRGDLDEFGYWNRTLTEAEIVELYNGGAGLNPFGAAPITTHTPNFLSPTPADGVHNNTNVTINVNCTEATTYLWFEDDPDPQQLALENTSSGSWLTNVTTETIYYYKAGCYNASHSGFSANSTVRNWTYDVTSPTIRPNALNAFNIYNFSNINNYQNLFPLNITFTDNIDLFAYEINISKGGVGFYNETNESISGTVFTYNRNVNITTWLAGRVNISISASDSHTKYKIGDYDVDKSNKKLKFTTEEGNKITIETNDDAITDAEKKKDRYEFIFNFTDGLTTDRIFYIKTQDHKIFYRPDTGYDAHFVVWSDKGGNWIDFEGYTTPTVTYINDKYWKIEFVNLPPNIRFTSIGGLNKNNKNYTWYRGTYVSYAPFGYYGESTTLTLNITKDASIDFINTTLYYNGTILTGTSRIAGTESVSFTNTFNAVNYSGDFPITWQMFYNQTNGNSTTFNVTDTQTIQAFGIGNCTTYNVTTLQLNVRDEDIPTVGINATVEIDSEFWITSPDNAFNFTQKFTNNNTYQLCINAQGLTLYSNFYIKYNTTYGFTHRYYIYNETFTNVTKTINIYNFNNQTGKSDLNLITRLANDYTYFPNVLTKLERRYISEGIWRTVQMDLSDEQGNMHFNIIEENHDYRIGFYDTSNHLLEQTGRFKFSCTSGVCSVTYLLNEYDASAIQPDFNVWSDYNNVTKILTITFNDISQKSTITRVVVSKQTMSSRTNICDQSYGSYAGTSTCNMTGIAGEVLMEVYSTASPEDARWAEWLKITNPLLSVVIGDTIETSFLSAGIILTIGAVGFFSPAGAVLFTIFGAIITFWLGLFAPLTIGIIVLLSIMGIVIVMKVKD